MTKRRWPPEPPRSIPGARSRQASVLACLVLAVSSPVLANGSFETYGPDARTRGMANAAVALDSVVAAHTNPAAVARSGRRPALAFGFALDTPALELDLDVPRGADDPLAPAVPPAVAGVSVGLLLPVDLVLRERLVLGAAIYAPTSVLVRVRTHDPQRPWFFAYDTATERLDASLAAGVRLTDWLFLGAGARLAGSETGTVALALDPVRGRVTRQALDASVEPAGGVTAGLLVGRLGIPGVVEGSFGLVYRDPISFRIAIPAGLAVEGLDVDSLLDIAILANHSPRSLTAGMAFDVFEAVSVDLEAQAAQWSEAPPPYMRVRVDLNGDGLEALGLEDGLDAPASGQERVAAPGFVDTINWRIGTEWRVWPETFALRAGYQFRPTPVPDQTSGTNVVDSDAHIVAAGAGIVLRAPWLLDRPITVDVAYQAQLLEERSTKKSSPIDEVGGWVVRGAVHGIALGVTATF